MARLACLICLTVCAWRGIAQQQNLNNVDILEPVVRASPDRVSPTLDGVNDYFGWSAIFHAIEEPTPSETLQSAQQKIRVMVGAPFGTFSGGLNLVDPFLPRENTTGLVYSCPVSPGTCEGVRGDLSAYINDEDLANNQGATQPLDDHVPPDAYCEGRLFDQAPNAIVTTSQLGALDFEGKEGQLLGASLYSNGEIFMACAPRWHLDFSFVTEMTNAFQRNLTRGICYSGRRNLQDFLPRVPCTSSAINNVQSNERENHCLAGHSAVVNNGHFVIGTPGYENNRGVLSSQPTNAPTHNDPFEFSPFAALDSTNTPILDSNPSGQDQYQGFRVINAYILNRTDSGMAPNLVTSVPRAGTNKDGRLHVYESPTTLNTLIFTNATGTQIGEFFGYSLAAADLDNNKYDDILVGAPIYTDFDTGRVEKGRVYIFRTIGAQLSGESRIVIEGPPTLPGRARFGTSLTSLGDVDYDGFDDFAVGAPYYQTGSSPHTGAVFIYYGRQDPADIPSQMPYTITADTMAMNVVLGMGMSLNTFGFSLSSGHDVDGNGYNDILVGAYESQTVYLLRSLPVADVNVTFVAHPTVNPDQDSNFTLEISAELSGVGVTGMLNVNFEITERARTIRRVFFDAALTPSARGLGTFMFTQHNTPVTASVPVFTIKDISDFEDFMFDITLLEITRTTNGPVTGNEALSDLSSFPRLRLQGETSTQVQVQNFCGMDGCKSDVLFDINSYTVPVVVGDPNPGMVPVTITNLGPEPALDLEVVITLLPVFVTSISAVDNIFTCSMIVNSTTACRYTQQRFNQGMFMATFVLGFDTSTLFGNESVSMIVFRLSVPEENGNEDLNQNNNELTVTLQPTAVADISVVSVQFSDTTASYTGVEPDSTDFVSQGVNALGTEITLEVAIGNNGPSTILSAILDVYFPSRLSSFDSSLSFLYLYDIQASQIFTCNRSQLDPADLLQFSQTRKRSAASFSEIRDLRKRNRAASANPVMAESNKRDKRQDMTDFDLDCTPNSPTRADCTRFTCSISNLRRDNVSVTFRSRIDERYFATLPESRRGSFNLRAFASVTLGESFVTGDSPTNNDGFGSINLSPMVPEVENTDLLHVILWPALGSLILLVLLIVALYFCGFFRRKKKHEEEGDAEGDFTVPTDGGGKSYSPEKKALDQNEEVTGL